MSLPDTSWVARANCRGANLDVFFPDRGDDVRPAKSVCAGCEVRVECLDDALEHGDKHGVRGGLSERERRRVRRQRKQRAA